MKAHGCEEITGVAAEASAVTGKPSCFSKELQQLALKFADRPVRLAELIESTQGKGYFLALIVISLPFLTPIPLPGFSIPFGVAVMMIGGRLAVGKKPWLPRRLLARELPPGFVGKVLRGATRLARWLEFFLRTRLVFLQDWMVFRRVAGVMIMLSGVLLLLPLPLPFSNSLPALTVLLLAAGALERDGLFFLAGCLMFVVCAAYFAFLALGGARLLENLWGRWLAS